MTSAMKIPIIFATIAGTFLLSYYLFHAVNDVITVTKHKNAFDLIVALTFKSDEDKKTFKSMFAVLADYVRTSEPTTLSYELSDSDRDPLRVLIIERYVNKVQKEAVVNYY